MRTWSGNAKPANPWTWTALRPHSVCGYAAGNPLNLALVLAIYGSIRRELERAVVVSGQQWMFRALFQVMDADLLARAAIHVATNPGCANNIYNVSNGDYFRWRGLVARLRRLFRVEGGRSGRRAARRFSCAP